MKNNCITAIQLTLYGRPECHLCEDMRLALDEYRFKLGFSLESIDIDTDPALQSQFGSLIPVLMHGQVEICHYFLDPHALQMYFSESPE